MPANTSPIFTLTPNIGRAQIATTNAQVKSDGTSAGSGADLMYKTFTAGANGSYVDRVRFTVVATAAVTSVAAVLRVYLSTIAAPGATIGGTDTWLIGEVTVPAIAAGSLTAVGAFYEIPLNIAVPTGMYLHVGQSAAQTTNQFWQSVAIGGDF